MGLCDMCRIECDRWKCVKCVNCDRFAHKKHCGWFIKVKRLGQNFTYFFCQNCLWERP